jgi:hypothetical protein
VGTIWDVDLLSRNDGWAVGERGRIAHWNGVLWSDVPSPTSLGLHGIDMVSPTDGWAVGDSGVIVRWEGKRWSLYPASLPNLRAVTMLSANDGWAVGWGIFHWDGMTWQAVASNSPLRHSMSSPPKAGPWRRLCEPACGTVLMHWDGQTGPKRQPITNGVMAGVRRAERRQGRRYGLNYPSTILHWDGSVGAGHHPQQRRIDCMTSDVVGHEAGRWAVTVTSCTGTAARGRGYPAQPASRLTR